MSRNYARNFHGNYVKHNGVLSSPVRASPRQRENKPGTISFGRWNQLGENNECATIVVLRICKLFIMYKSELMGDRYVSIASTRSRQQRFKTCLRVGGERFHLPSGEFHPILAIRPRYIILFLCRFCCFHATDPPLSGFRYGSPFSLLFLFFFLLSLSPLSSPFFTRRSRGMHVECKRTNNRGERLENSRSNCTIRFTMFSVSRWSGTYVSDRFFDKVERTAYVVPVQQVQYSVVKRSAGGSTTLYRAYRKQ